MPSRLRASRRAERVALGALVAFYLASVLGFAIVTPYGEAPDEPAHVGYVEYLVRFGRLPDIAKRPYTVDAFHPPLYYALGALVVLGGRAVIGPAGFEDQLAAPVIGNPDFGKQRKRTGGAAMVHPPQDRWPIWVYTLRAVSALLGLGVVLLTYATARALVPWPAPAVVPLASAAFAALIPEANFIRASVSNENLADLVGALIIWLLVLHLMRPYSATRVLWIGVALGLALLTKLSVSPLLLPALWVLWVRREGHARLWLRDLATVAAPMVALAGWLYVYKWVVYGDPLALAAWHEMLPPDSMFKLSDLFWFQHPFRWFLWSSFWGVYGWQILWMPYWIYHVFAGVTVLAAAGGVVLLARRALSPAQRAACAVLLSALLLLYALVVQASTYLVAWQGREMYPALSSICVLLGLGLGGLALGRAAVQPTRLSPARHLLGTTLVLALALGLLAANIYSIIWVIWPVMRAT
jgi:hypothetical protein